MPSAQQQLSHYLYKPSVSPDMVDGAGVVTSWSSFWLALRDARIASGRDPDDGSVVDPVPATMWLGAVGYLVWLDQLGTAVRRPTLPTNETSAIRRALEAFSGLAPDEHGVVYALRNALAHDYSLVNAGGAGKHLFRLEWDQQAPLIEFPDNPWDGDFATASGGEETVVNLFKLTEVAEGVVLEVLAAHASGDLELNVSVDEAEHRYFVTIT